MAKNNDYSFQPGKVVTDRRGEESAVTEKEFAEMAEQMHSIAMGNTNGFFIGLYETSNTGDEITGSSFFKANEVSRARVLDVVFLSLEMDAKDVMEYVIKRMVSGKS